VTLEPFDASLEEEVDVDFAEAGREPVAAAHEDRDHEPPDEITGGRIDLGALTAEFLALGLDPYPRKPGAAFAFEGQDAKPDSPFAALKGLKGEG
jgi:hypothetical protein